MGTIVQENLEEDQVQRNHVHAIMQSLNNLRTQKAFTDLTLVCDGQEFPVHKAVLAASSAYFQDLCESLNGGIKIELHMADLKPDILAQVLHFIYTGKITHKFDTEDLELLLKVTEEVQMGLLFQLCFQQLIKVCLESPETKIPQILKSKKIDCIKRCMVEYSVENFSQIRESKLFFMLPEDFVIAILSHPKMHNASMDDRITTVLKWVEYDEDGRSKSLSQIIPLIDFELLSGDCVMELTENDLVDRIPVLAKKVMQAMKIHYRAARLGSSRCSSSSNFSLVEASEITSSTATLEDSKIKAQKSLQDFQTTKVNDNESIKKIVTEDPTIKQQTDDMNVLFERLRFTNSVYVREDAKRPQSCVEEMGKNKNEDVKDLNTNMIALTHLNRKHFMHNSACNPDDNSTVEEIEAPLLLSSVASSNNKVYFIGGRSTTWKILSSVTVFDIVTKKWTKCNDISAPRFSSGSAAMQDLVYVVGGIDYRNIRIDTVERYNPTSNTWTIVAPMKTCREKPSVVSYNGTLFVVGGYSITIDQNKEREMKPEACATCEIYMPSTDQWTILESNLPIGRQVKEKCFCVAVFRDRIFAINTRAFNSSACKTSRFLSEYSWATKKWEIQEISTELKEIVAIGELNNCLCMVDMNGRRIFYDSETKDIVQRDKILSPSLEIEVDYVAFVKK